VVVDDLCEHCGTKRPLHLLTCPVSVKGMAEGKKKEAPEPLRQLLIDLSNNTYFCGLHQDDMPKYDGFLREAEQAEQAIIELFVAQPAGAGAPSDLTDRRILDIFNDCPDSISTVGFARAIEREVLARAAPAVTADERTLFQQKLPHNKHMRRPDGEYAYVETQAAWEAWQARATVVAPTVPAEVATSIAQARADGERIGRAVIDIHLDQMRTNEHYREREFNEILKLDADAGRIRFKRISKSEQAAQPAGAGAPSDADELIRQARHAVFNLKEFRAGRSTFPGEALGILEKALDGLARQGAAPAPAEPVANDRADFILACRRALLALLNAADDRPIFKQSYDDFARAVGVYFSRAFPSAPAPVAQAAICQPGGEPEWWLGRDGRMTDELRSFLEGMTVSMDVSTGDHDFDHRYYGTISEVMDGNDKNGVTLLVYDAQPNFPVQAPQAAQQVAVDDARWAKEPPTEQADYWHWDGDEDHAPMIYHVLWSGTAKKCFVSIGQYGIDEAIWCDNFGGYWMKIEQPSTRDAAMSRTAKEPK
jgi:hypothetical protein